MRKRIFALVLSLVMVFSLAACNKAGKEESKESEKETTAEQKETEADKEVTLKFLSNLTDRTTGQGLIEQQLMDMYTKEHPNVHFEIETLGDADCQTKFKSYVTAKTYPDLTVVWCIPSYMDAFMEGGVFAEVPQDYVDSAKFANGSLDYCSKDGKVYALGRNTDVMVFYYNKDLFEKYGVKVPETYDDLLKAADVFTENDIIPCAMSGSASWCDSHFVTGIIGTLVGADTQKELQKAITDGDFSADFWKKSCDLAVQGAEKLFQFGFETYDYGTAENLFLNGEAAMWWMGSWEMSVATDFNMGAFAMPTADPSVEEALFAFPGGGYAVCKGTENEAVAMDFLKFMFEPEHWSKLAWEQGVCMSAQNFYDYLTGNETPVQLDILAELNNAKSWTGLNYKDYDARMADSTDKNSIGLLSKLMTTEEYIQGMIDQAASRE